MRKGGHRDDIFDRFHSSQKRVGGDPQQGALSGITGSEGKRKGGTQKRTLVLLTMQRANDLGKTGKGRKFPPLAGGRKERGKGEAI